MKHFYETGIEFRVTEADGTVGFYPLQAVRTSTNRAAFKDILRSAEYRARWIGALPEFKEYAGRLALVRTFNDKKKAKGNKPFVSYKAYPLHEDNLGYGVNFKISQTDVLNIKGTPADGEVIVADFDDRGRVLKYQRIKPLFDAAVKKFAGAVTAGMVNEANAEDQPDVILRKKIHEYASLKQIFVVYVQWDEGKKKIVSANIESIDGMPVEVKPYLADLASILAGGEVPTGETPQEAEEA